MTKPPDPKFFPDHGNPQSLTGSTTGEPSSFLGRTGQRKAKLRAKPAVAVAATSPAPEQSPAAKAEADAIKAAYEKVQGCTHEPRPCAPCILGAISGVMLAEREIRAQEANAAFYERFLRTLGIEPLADKVCDACQGVGWRMYGSSSTWRGGIGGQTMTHDVCSKCWGSGCTNRPGTDLRWLSTQIGNLKLAMRRAWDAAGRVVQEARHHQGSPRLPAALREKIDDLEKATLLEAMKDPIRCGWCGAQGEPMAQGECKDAQACAARMDAALKAGDPSTYEARIARLRKALLGAQNELATWLKVPGFEDHPGLLGVLEEIAEALKDSSP